MDDLHQKISHNVTFYDIPKAASQRNPQKKVPEKVSKISIIPPQTSNS